MDEIPEYRESTMGKTDFGWLDFVQQELRIGRFFRKLKLVKGFIDEGKVPAINFERI